MRLVAKKRPVEVAWKLFSLAEINKNQEMDEAHRISHAKGRKMERMLLAARRQGGNDALERLYMAIGDAHHGRKDDLNDESVVVGCLKQAGLPPTLYSDQVTSAGETGNPPKTPGIGIGVMSCAAATIETIPQTVSESNDRSDPAGRTLIASTLPAVKSFMN